MHKKNELLWWIGITAKHIGQKQLNVFGKSWGTSQIGGICTADVGKFLVRHNDGTISLGQDNETIDVLSHPNIYRLCCLRNVFVLHELHNKTSYFTVTWLMSAPDEAIIPWFRSMEELDFDISEYQPRFLERVKQLFYSGEERIMEQDLARMDIDLDRAINRERDKERKEEVILEGDEPAGQGLIRNDRRRAYLKNLIKSDGSPMSLRIKDVSILTGLSAKKIYTMENVFPRVGLRKPVMISTDEVIKYLERKPIEEE